MIHSTISGFFLLLSCSLATSAYKIQLRNDSGWSAGWSLVLPWLGWVFSLFLIPLTVVQLIGGGAGSSGGGGDGGDQESQREKYAEK